MPGTRPGLPSATLQDMENSAPATQSRPQPADDDSIAYSWLPTFLCGPRLPAKDPGDAAIWQRRDGNLHIVLRPGEAGYPYGLTARRLLMWICTQAVRNPARRDLGAGISPAQILRSMDMTPTGGVHGTVNRLLDQANRLTQVRVMVAWEGDPQRDLSSELRLLDVRDGHTAGDLGALRINPEFHAEILRRPVPLSEAAVASLKSPLAFDIYTWLARRLGTLAAVAAVASPARADIRVPWHSLMEQFAPDGRGTQAEFAASFAEQLQAVLQVYPPALIELTDEGITLSRA